MPEITPREERVAVVGAGPAGLAIARELALKGIGVDVFDSLPYGGGTMLIGVPAFRLPREAIEMDVRLVERLGVRFHFNTTIGSGITFEQLQADYDAVAIAAGAMNAVVLDIPGAELEGVQYGVDFMKKANLGEELVVGGDVVVIGGGYTAMDCSRTSLRHGAGNVTIAYRRTRSELVVDEEELGETEREGVRMEFLVSPIELVGKDGKLTGVRFIRNKLGEPDASGRRSPVPIPGSEFVVPADTVIPAVSQAADLTFLPVESTFEVNRGRLKVDPATYATNVRGVFACGDFVTGPTTLIEAAGHGKKCAYRSTVTSPAGPTSASPPRSASSARGATRCPSSTTCSRASTSRWSLSRSASRPSNPPSTSRPRSSSGTRPTRRWPNPPAA
jgi:NADPH-dependent glutamate synthase beta subunit-like oxidoreductase